MKKSIQKRLFRKSTYAFLPVIIAFLFTACQTNTNEADVQNSIMGTWHQTVRTIDGAAVAKDSTRLLFQINSNNICILCDSTTAAVKAKTIVKRSGWSFTGGTFNLAIDIPAAWQVNSTATELTMDRSDFKTDGTLSKTVLKFTKVANIVIK